MSRSRFARRRDCRTARGYTMVEVMMALAIFMVAMLGMITMQKAAVSSNAHARNMGMAQHLARAWAAQLEVDATQWKNTLSGDWLTTGNADTPWFRPAYVGTRKFGAGFDAQGNALSDTTADKKLTRFCTNVRLSWLFPNTMSMAGNGVLRAEIRVYWLREGASPIATFCNEDPSQTSALGLRPDLYQFVYVTTAVRQHSSI